MNRTESAAQLFWDAAHSRVVDPETFARLRRIAGQRMRADGTVVIMASGFRSQARNRADALRRLEAMLEQARQRPKARRPTVPSAASRRRRLEQKRRRSAVKAMRRSPLEE